VFVLAFFLDFFELAFIIVPLLAPAADKLGIDLIWFGVLLGVNMQTSFMHPPFGFALFYLRSVAARVPYIDRITKKTIQPVTTGQIYWGAVPFVLIQVVMVGLTITFPQMVMHYKGKVVDPSEVEIVVPPFGGNQQPGLGLPPLGAPADGGGNAPATPGQPAAPATPDLSQPPSFGEPPAKPAAPAKPDLSQPPKFN
jgi:tripartite ATP-independent transporter DctM subunit